MDIDSLFQKAIDTGASDLLLTAGAPPGLRIDGELHIQETEPLHNDRLRAMIYSKLTDEQIEKLEVQRELDLAFQFDEDHRFRGNVFFTVRGIGANFRLLVNDIPSIRELGLPETLEKIALERQGLVLITGPTGHGKSTTLAAMINVINSSRRAHIVTIEDPIEFLHENHMSVIDQREVGPHTISFASALRHVLRQSPDVILIGEMRDLETISTALTAAETGHLVLSTLHTNDAAQTIDRLVDVFPPDKQSQVRTQLAMCLLAVLSQRLVPKYGGGRVVATELLRRTPAVANMIREGNTHQVQTVIETQSRIGMHTMDSSLKRLFEDGLISLETAMDHIRNPRTLDNLA